MGATVEVVVVVPVAFVALPFPPELTGGILTPTFKRGGVANNGVTLPVLAVMVVPVVAADGLPMLPPLL